MRILAFAASNSRRSINRVLVENAVSRLHDTIAPEAKTERLDLNDYDMPIYSIDREREAGIPAPALDFFGQIGAADAVLVSYAEHNGSVTAAWKNLFDWMSRIEMKLWQGKPLVMLAASPGSRAGAGVLADQSRLAPHFGAELRGTLGIGKWAEAWDAEALALARPEDRAALDALLFRLVQPSRETFPA
ncbi:NADPH-dependent FMN reductase [Roseisalinus antarcticus]|uniref:NADPH-dependent FMN reductase n=1 Tax=Roseisalinus antarcticus TaxID=254357 RepID=A0A1Y5TV76_9RHOB|nr:NAD(P)H-dependent oxidoreductase [Roseisalinus antarcticus]SLN73540.1 NADPH-dependent FMN reductase [Roseisalinus antarcticus]